jgi:hypothetical protein
VARYVWRRVKAPFALPSRLHYLAATGSLLYSRLDPYTIRAVLALGSFLWALGQIPWNGFDPFSLKGYEVLNLFGPSWMWAGLFVLHGGLVTWRLIELKERPTWHRVVNYFGFCLWSFTTLAFNLSLHRYTSGTALEWAMVLMSGFALAHSGLRKEPVTL